MSINEPYWVLCMGLRRKASVTQVDQPLRSIQEGGHLRK